MIGTKKLARKICLVTLQLFSDKVLKPQTIKILSKSQYSVDSKSVLLESVILSYDDF